MGRSDSEATMSEKAIKFIIFKSMNQQIHQAFFKQVAISGIEESEVCILYGDV